MKIIDLGAICRVVCIVHPVQDFFTLFRVKHITLYDHISILHRNLNHGVFIHTNVSITI